MRGVVMYGPSDVRVERRDDPKILKPTDAVIRLAATCVCGSDLWPYRGIEPVRRPSPMGHEYAGIIEEAGGEVRDVKPGDFVVGSFMASDGTCATRSKPGSPSSTPPNRTVPTSTRNSPTRPSPRPRPGGSSSSVYGQQEGLLSETAAIAPRTAYAAANAAAERDILALAGPGFTACAVRQATVFGVSPRMRLDLVVHQMVVQGRSRGSVPVLGDGRQWRPFVHVADVCEAMLLLLRADPDAVRGELFNLGGDHLNHTVRDLAEQVGNAVGVSRVHSYPGLDDRSHRMDFAKVRERLGFVPSRSVADGARETAAAISRGDVDVDDPKTMTVQRYQHLLGSGAGSPAVVTGRGASRS